MQLAQGGARPASLQAAAVHLKHRLIDSTLRAAAGKGGTAVGRGQGVGARSAHSRRAMQGASSSSTRSRAGLICCKQPQFIFPLACASTSPILAAHGPGAGDVAAVPVILAAAIQQYHLVTSHRLHSTASAAHSRGRGTGTVDSGVRQHSAARHAAFKAAFILPSSSKTINLRPACLPTLSFRE
jgi:hypothetical protein